MWLGSSVVRVLGSSSDRAMFFFLACDMCLEYIIGEKGKYIINGLILIHRPLKIKCKITK